MPKIGQKPDNRPYNLRCTVCGCLVEKVVSRFGFNGRPAAHAYRCAMWGHRCGTAEREACNPTRVYDEPIAHALSDGHGGVWEHPGTPEDCTMPECVEKGSHKAGLSPSGVRHLGKYEDCYEPECEPPF